MSRAGWPQAGGTDITRAPAWVAVSAPPFGGRLKLKRPRYKANSITFGQTLKNGGGFSLQHLDAAVRPRDGAGEAQGSDGARRGWVCCAQEGLAPGTRGFPDSCGLRCHMSSRS